MPAPKKTTLTFVCQTYAEAVWAGAALEYLNIAFLINEDFEVIAEFPAGDYRFDPQDDPLPVWLKGITEPKAWEA